MKQNKSANLDREENHIKEPIVFVFRYGNGEGNYLEEDDRGAYADINKGQYEKKKCCRQISNGWILQDVKYIRGVDKETRY